MSALYQIAAEYRADLDKLADLDLDPQTLADTIEGMGGELEAKATNVAFFIRNLEHTAEGIKAAEKELKARRETLERRIENVTKYLKTTMEALGISKIEGPMLRLTIKKNPPAVVIFDEKQIPPFFWRRPAPPPPPEPTIDKAAIKQAIADGEEVAGAKAESSTRLEIKS